jgi:hypothetical protein
MSKQNEQVARRVVADQAFCLLSFNKDNRLVKKVIQKIGEHILAGHDVSSMVEEEDIDYYPELLS